MTGPFKIAAAQYPIGSPANWSEYEKKITEWVGIAAAAGSKLLVFPEYFSMELVHLFPDHIRKSLSLQLGSLQEVASSFIDLFSRLALAHQVHIVAGTFPILDPDGLYRNRSYLFFPDGHHAHQDKVQMTRFENEQWKISPGHHIRTFDTELGRLGISICYDSEFPLLARQQVEAGADLIVVPSCTDTLAGYWRVRIGCQARALENQCYVVQSPTVGHAAWSEAVDVNIGAAAIYTPVDYGFPDNGVLNVGELNASQWVYADVDLANIAHIRNNGQVFNHRDWPSQFRNLDSL